MQRLAGVDAGFLYMETPALHMHTLKLGVLQVPPHVSFDLMVAELGRRLHLMPPLRRRIVPTPLGLHHPVWFEDVDVDVAQHVHRVVLPAPGSWEQLEEVVGRVASRPLDRTRPLWEMHVVEGLADGRVAVLAKVHHALADGVASAALLANVMDASPPGLRMPEQGVPHPDRPVPRRALWRAALRDWARDLRGLPSLLLRTLRAVAAVVRLRRRAAVKTPRPLLDPPRTPFNRALTPRRVFATVTLPLEDVKRVRRALGVPFTDVVLAVVGGALRDWLLAHGELPARPLVAGVPLAVDDPLAGGRLVGNRVSNLFTTLATDVADPVERLQRIVVVTAEARAMQEALGLDMLERWTQFTPPGLFSAAMRAYSALHLADHHRPPLNVVVSNVPGPRHPLEVAGIRLDHLYSVGPILEGIGLNITLWSYRDGLDVGAIACPDTLPDLRGVVDRLAPALAELVTAAENVAAESTAPRR